jgi:starvation-inducible DNA-binding protein
MNCRRRHPIDMGVAILLAARRTAGLPRGRSDVKITTQENKRMDMDIGISEQDRHAIVDGLSRLLADTYTLYLKTHNFHWNVTGPMFQTLHLMFETQYTELADAVDVIAERIRALGSFAPGTYGDFARLSTINEPDGVPNAQEMIRQLVQDQEAVIRTARSMFKVLEQANDEPTADLLTQRMQIHEKTAWMLRSLLEK